MTSTLPGFQEKPAGANPMRDIYGPKDVEELLKSFEGQNSGSSLAKVLTAIEELNKHGQFIEGAYDKAKRLAPSYFPLSGGKRKSKSRRSKKRSSRKTNATRRR
jgi:hypothetical protein